MTFRHLSKFEEFLNPEWENKVNNVVIGELMYGKVVRIAISYVSINEIVIFNFERAMLFV